MTRTVPKELRRLIVIGFLLAFAGLCASYRLSKGLYACHLDGRATSYRTPPPPYREAQCADVLAGDCARKNAAAQTRKKALDSLNELRGKHAEGSLAFAANRPAIEYLEGVVKAPATDGADRREVWRWAGILIFLFFCSAGGYLLLRQMRKAGLPVGDDLAGWRVPFWSTLAFSNLVNAAGNWRRDLSAAMSVTWQTYCNDWVTWLIERMIILGASTTIAFACAALWAFASLDRTQKLDLQHPDGSCGARDYVAILQRWCVATPVLLVVPSFLWMAAEARKPTFEVSFAFDWLIITVPMLAGVARLIMRAHALRAAYQLAVEAVGPYKIQQDAKLPPDPTTPILGADGWTPITAGMVLIGVLWAIIEWSGGGRAIHALGW